MKVLVTGGTGFIGSYLTKYLTDIGYDAYVLLRSSSDLTRLKKLSVKPKLIIGDITNYKALESSVKDKDYVFHLAAIIKSKKWIDYYNTNYIGTLNIVKAIKQYNRNIKKFIYISSIAASGPSKKGYLKNENDRCSPVDYYGKSKLLGENAVKTLLKDIPYTIIRPPNVIGPGQQELMQAITIIKKGFMPILGNRDKQLSLIDVRDLVRAIILAATSKNTTGKTYFITDGKVYSWVELSKMIKEALNKGFTVPVTLPAMLIISSITSIINKIFGKNSLFSPKQVLHLRKSYLIYNSKMAEKDFGFKPENDIKDSIRMAVKEIVNNIQ